MIYFYSSRKILFVKFLNGKVGFFKESATPTTASAPGGPPWRGSPTSFTCGTSGRQSGRRFGLPCKEKKKNVQKSKNPPTVALALAFADFYLCSSCKGNEFNPSAPRMPKSKNPLVRFKLKNPPIDFCIDLYTGSSCKGNDFNPASAKAAKSKNPLVIRFS